MCLPHTASLLDLLTRLADPLCALHRRRCRMPVTAGGAQPADATTTTEVRPMRRAPCTDELATDPAVVPPVDDSKLHTTEDAALPGSVRCPHTVDIPWVEVEMAGNEEPCHFPHSVTSTFNALPRTRNDRGGCRQV